MSRHRVFCLRITNVPIRLKVFTLTQIFFTICQEKVYYKVCNSRYKVSNTYYKVCNTCYKLCNKNYLI